ncbi:M20 family metallopeptidase [Fusibacter sp. JL298sf-3]
MTEILKKLLSQPSVNGTPGERAIALCVFEHLTSAGMPTYLQHVSEDRYNVIAHIKGDDRTRCVLWNGHLDTVPFGDLEKWSTPPDVPHESAGVVYARGASDMKGGLAAMVDALCGQYSEGRRPKTDIVFLATCDEEKGGAGAEAFLKTQFAQRLTFAFVGEPTGNVLGTAQKGCLWVKIVVEGRTAHGAYPDKGENAVVKAFRLYGSIQMALAGAAHPLLGETTVNLASIHGGTAHNMVPDTCEMLLDIRYVPAVSDKRLFGALDAPEVKTYDVLNHRRPIDAQSEAPHLFHLLKMPSKQIGVRYFTDASVLAKQLPHLPVVLLGPGAPDKAHQPDECLSLAAYDAAVAYYKMLYRDFE